MRIAAAPTSNFALVAALLTACFAAVLLGLVSTTENPIAIAVCVGVVFGGALFLRPKAGFYIALVGALFVVGLVMQFAPNLVKLNWLFAILSMALMAIAIFSRLLSNVEEPLPGIFYLVLGLIGYCFVVSMVVSPSTGEIFAGFKRYFQSWGLFVAIVALMFVKDDLRRLKQVFVVAAFTQLPFALYQRLVWVPAREGMGNGVVPIDVVAGTFEASFTGGGADAVQAFLLVMGTAYMFKLWMTGRLSGGRLALLLPLIAIPYCIGETKIVIVMLPIMILVALKAEMKARPMLGVGLVVGTVGLALMLGIVYTLALTSSENSFDKQIARGLSYNFGSEGYSDTAALNRTTVLSFWAAQQRLSDPIGFFFGHGMGSTYMSDTASVAPGRLAQAYPNMGIGGTAASTVLWETGIVGFALFLSVLVWGWRIAAKAARKHNGTYFGCSMAVVEGALVVNIIFFFYTDAHVLLYSYAAIQAVLIGAAVRGLRLPRAVPSAAAQATARARPPAAGFVMPRR